ncbi:cytochrome b/b6 domain-containing protein [Solidesulfovibrio sp.]|uniref:cytochrome b n=1 Tax=Solidesulfovibrio sp. TaxID=2910990 RepID=UPI00260FB2E4|nr:cytochrome b/b6 domain-containing protein [Solidesulfovibrio sp.]
MAASDNVTGYDPVWKAMHWLTVAVVLALFLLGGTMSRGTPFLVMWHESLGIFVLLLTLARLLWRATHVPPPLPGGLRPWEAFAAVAVHKLFYVFLVLQPLIGWGLYSLSSNTTLFFGLFPIPKLPLGELAGQAARGVLAGAHGAGAASLAILFVLHAGAALKHHFVLRDNVLLRMAPDALAGALRKLRGE